MPGDETKTEQQTQQTATAPTTAAPEVTFPTRAAFHQEVERKAKHAKEEAAAAERQRIYAELEIEDPETEIAQLKTWKASNKKTLSELEKLQKEHGKASAQVTALSAELNQLRSFKAGVLKEQAIRAHAADAADPDLLVAYLRDSVKLDDEGKVTGADGESIDKLVANAFKAKPLLKRPETRPGQGTTPTSPAANGGASGGARLSFAARIAQEAAAGGTQQR